VELCNKSVNFEYFFLKFVYVIYLPNVNTLFEFQLLYSVSYLNIGYHSNLCVASCRAPFFYRNSHKWMFSCVSSNHLCLFWRLPLMMRYMQLLNFCASLGKSLEWTKVLFKCRQQPVLVSLYLCDSDLHSWLSLNEDPHQYQLQKWRLQY